MKIDLHPKFVKSYKTRIAKNPKLLRQTQKRLAVFSRNPFHPILRNHKLTGSKHILHAFSISGDIRIVYYEINPEHIVFLDIGSHNQLY
jgi:addiction module RelE/StbE family toxin